jgi:hypothetical protein
MQEIQTKYFTPAEANRTLPLVKKIVRDILNDVYMLKTLSESLGGNVENNSEFKQLTININGYMGELEEIGCSYKDWNFDIGLVDFPSVINGEEVLLCWRSDENEIRFYHGINDGFAGRKLIPSEYL